MTPERRRAPNKAPQQRRDSASHFALRDRSPGSVKFPAVAQQAKKRRRKKHRGTQGGGIDTRGPRGRPRTREEAKARARQKQGRGKQGARAVDRRDVKPTWRSAFYRGLFGAAIFFLLFWLAFGRPAGAALGLSAVLLLIYVPLGYYVDTFFWRRRMRQLQAARAAAKQERRGGGN
jgi:hypothetical protein